MGTDNIPINLRRAVEDLSLYALVLVPAYLVGLIIRRPTPPVDGLSFVVGFSVVGGMLWSSRQSPDWMDFFRPLPLFVVTAGIVFFLQLYRRYRTGQPLDRAIRQLSLTIFALVLLGKMILNARIYHYGFVLAMPATLLLVVAILDWLPQAVASFGGAGGVVRGAGLAMLGVAVVALLGFQSHAMSAKTNLVGTGADAFWSDWRGQFVNEALQALADKGGSDNTLAVFPEGVMINYLARCSNPTPYIFFTPFDVNLFGEEKILAAIQARPPDLVILVHKNTWEYGYPYFGKDYGQKLMAWILDSYEQVYRTGDQPFQPNSRFGIVLMRRKDHSSSRGSMPRGL
jgi:hypothetical protein